MFLQVEMPTIIMKQAGMGFLTLVHSSAVQFSNLIGQTVLIVKYKSNLEISL